MVVWKIFKWILHAVLSVVVYILQLLLTVVGVVSTVLGSYAETIGALVGGLFIVTSLICIAIGNMEWPIFWKMTLIGVAFEAIPMLINHFAVEGILSIKELLYRCLEW